MTDKEITELNLKSATYYGAQLQMNHFTEELAELIQAAAEGDPQHIAEEIADVEVMVEQMEYCAAFYKITATSQNQAFEHGKETFIRGFANCGVTAENFDAEYDIGVTRGEKIE